jgi:hypothetical protein
MNGWSCESEIRNAEMSVHYRWSDGRRTIRRRYDTPVGSVYEDLVEEPGYHSQTIQSFLIKSPADYAVVRYMVENTIFREQYQSFIDAEKQLGEDGVQFAVTDRSPFQKLLIELCGPQRLHLDYADDPALVDGLLQAMAAKMDEAFDIVAASPAEIVWIVDNVTCDLTPPRMFQRYCLPFYQRQVEKLHAAGKVVLVHFDGRLGPISRLIGQTQIDVVESFSLPGMGNDMTLRNACAAWPDKAIVANIPACLCSWPEPRVREYVRNLLLEVRDHGNFMLELSENFPPEGLLHTLPIVADEMTRQQP